MSIYYINGKFVSEENALVSARDLAVLRGYGAFDFLRTYGGKPFRLMENVKRLRRSCELIELSYAWSDEEIYEIVMQTLEHNAGLSDEYNIRLVITGGVSSDNITPEGQPGLIIMVSALHRLPREWYEDGVKVVTVELERTLPGAKSINYIPAIMAQRRARAASAVEALYVTEGNVTEGTTTNLFALYGNTLVTPQEGILPGITRKTILDLAQPHYDVQRRALPLDELLQADEVFITAANKQVVPVVRINDVVIGGGTPGEGTQHIMAMFKEETERIAESV